MSETVRSWLLAAIILAMTALSLYRGTLFRRRPLTEDILLRIRRAGIITYALAAWGCGIITGFLLQPVFSAR